MESLLPASQTGAESSLLRHVSFWRGFLIAQFVVLVLFPLKGYPDTYPATREYYAWIGSGVSTGYTSPAQPDFLNAGNVAWDGWQVPVFWPSGITKVEWFTDGNCQGKAEPVFISQSSWVLIWASYQWPTGVIGCSGTSNYIFINLTCPYGGNVVVDQCYNAPPCPPSSLRNPKTGKCEPPETYTITLKPDRTTTEPSTNLGLTVTVENQDRQPPKNPVQVKISLKVDPKSGGHDHGDSTRPRGGINSKDCVSDDTCVTLSIGGPGSSGSASITFNALDASGEHAITATCDKCSNGPQEAKVDVKVKESEQAGWDTLTASPTEYVLTGGETGKTHHNNHYLTGTARENLLALVYEYNNAFPSGPLLRLNDASLVWGGVFDYDANSEWKPPHSNHRRGIVIDIRANQDVTAIPQSRFNDFEKYAKQSGAYADLHCAFSGKYICPACLLDTGPKRHYHVRLLGQGIDR